MIGFEGKQFDIDQLDSRRLDFLCTHLYWWVQNPRRDNLFLTLGEWEVLGFYIDNYYVWNECIEDISKYELEVIRYLTFKFKVFIYYELFGMSALTFERFPTSVLV